MNILTGKNFRLPTEAEWEYAARGANKGSGSMYAGSDNIPRMSLGIMATATPLAVTAPITVPMPWARSTATGLGLYDMSGNVHEWCTDAYAPYGTEQPTSLDESQRLVIRGGCWFSLPKDCRSTSRSSEAPDMRFYTIGLRLAL